MWQGLHSLWRKQKLKTIIFYFTLKTWNSVISNNVTRKWQQRKDSPETRKMRKLSRILFSRSQMNEMNVGHYILWHTYYLGSPPPPLPHDTSCDIWEDRGFIPNDKPRTTVGPKGHHHIHQQTVLTLCVWQIISSQKQEQFNQTLYKGNNTIQQGNGMADKSRVDISSLTNCQLQENKKTITI